MGHVSTRPRFQVSNLGFGYAVHDTQAKAPYEFPAGAEKKHPSRNDLNSRKLAIFPTRAQAQAYADELNAREGSAR